MFPGSRAGVQQASERLPGSLASTLLSHYVSMQPDTVGGNASLFVPEDGREFRFVAICPRRAGPISGLRHGHQ